MTIQTSEDITLVARLGRVGQELEDILECAGDYRADLDDVEDADERRLLKGVMHKTEEAIHKVHSAWMAAVQADRTSKGLNIFTGEPLQ